jgi:hypothetical protein
MTPNPDANNDIAAEIVVEDICSDFDQVVVYRSRGDDLTAHPFAREKDDVYTETDHDLREYSAVQAVVAGQLDNSQEVTWHIPVVDLGWL